MSPGVSDPQGPIVVTGGAGFLGGVVVEQLLARGVKDIRVIDVAEPSSSIREKNARRGVRYFVRDIRDAMSDEAAFAGAKTVLHLAACQYHTPLARSTYELPFFPVNVEGTRHVLEAAKGAGARHFVFVSTNMVYGLPRTLPLTETHARDPFGPYGQSKLAAERLVEGAHSPDFDCTIVRPGLIVGPGRTGVIERVFKWLTGNRPVVMIGSGNNRYEVMHVEDVASLVIAASARRGFAAYNCAAVSVPTMREWIEEVKRLAGSRSPIIGVPGRMVKPALAMLERVRLAPLRKDQFLIADIDYFMDAGAARTDLGWTPRFDGREAILDTYHWYVERSRS
jgi:dTDP-glucose 4,6-dehydratase